MKINNFSFFSFRNRYIPALLILALFSTLAFFNVKEIIASIKNEGKMINISGRQRMLSQKLILLGKQYIENPNVTTKEILEENIQLMKTSHEYLLQNTSYSNLNALYYTNKLDSDIKNYLAFFEVIIQTKDLETLRKMANEAQILLEKLDNVVKAYEKQYEEKLISLEQKGKYLLLSIFFVLFLEWVFIFRPASQKIKEYTLSLEDAIEAKTKELQESINLISQNIIYSKTDTRGVITYASEAFCEISGYTKKELLSKSHNIVRHYDMPKEAFKEMWEMIQSGNTWTGEVKNRKKDGSFYWVRAFVSPEFDHFGNIIGYVAIRHDITHKKALEELNKTLEEKIQLEVEKNRTKDIQLFNQSKMASLGEMLGNIAHQWRQPLNGISIMTSSLLLSKELDTLNDETFNKYCNEILKTTQVLSETIHTFRDFIDGEKEFKKIVLQEQIDSTLHIEKTIFEQYHINLINTIDYKNPILISTIIGDLSQVIINLLKNAKDILVERKIENPWIKINLLQDGSSVILTIEDNGGGISEDIMPQIFEPYFTTKHQSQGTGLGLYMSYKIITESLQGKLYAKNTQDGAMFCIELVKERAQ